VTPDGAKVLLELVSTDAFVWHLPQLAGDPSPVLSKPMKLDDLVGFDADGRVRFGEDSAHDRDWRHEGCIGALATTCAAALAVYVLHVELQENAQEDAALRSWSERRRKRASARSGAGTPAPVRSPG
jgi:hypothetical protein